MTRMGRRVLLKILADRNIGGPFASFAQFAANFVFLNDAELFVDTRDVDRFEHLFGREQSIRLLGLV